MIGENLQPMIEKRMEKEEVGEALEPVLLVVVGMHQQQVGLEDHLKVVVLSFTKMFPINPPQKSSDFVILINI